MLKYRYKAYVKGTKEQAVDIAINGSGIRDTSRVLGISKSTVISTLKNTESRLVQVNPNIKALAPDGHSKVSVCLACEEAEIDEQWSFVSKKIKSAMALVCYRSCNQHSACIRLRQAQR